MATVRHVTTWTGRTKYQAAWFLLNRVYKTISPLWLRVSYDRFIGNWPDVAMIELRYVCDYSVIYVEFML